MPSPRTSPPDAAAPPAAWPAIRTVGATGLLVSFSDRLSEGANRAALAFRAAVEAAAWPGVEETSTSLVSAFLRVDPLGADPADLQSRLAALLAERDWTAAPLPAGRRHWRVPTAYGTDLAPQLEEAAAAAGMSAADAAAQLSATRVRVLTIGFAPGQPYLGELPEAWNLPRQQQLTARVPAGALVLAIRQFVLFSAPAPTGWRHVGQTAFRAFRPDDARPFPLRPGDEVTFAAAERDHVAALLERGEDGAEVEEIR